ncbi:hypothetical protein HKCCSP123_06225 [Rhodobacterales bacterium HKCCSP123]|nr:hypothetical protein [Rhodobacterales bacterium HKCCSP123]
MSLAIGLFSHHARQLGAGLFHQFGVFPGGEDRLGRSLHPLEEGDLVRVPALADVGRNHGRDLLADLLLHGRAEIGVVQHPAQPLELVADLGQNLGRALREDASRVGVRPHIDDADLLDLEVFELVDHAVGLLVVCGRRG